MKKVLDKNGKEIHVDMHVIMPEPNEDNLNDSWEGGGWCTLVDDVLDNGNIIVEDGMFEIAGNRVEID